MRHREPAEPTPRRCTPRARVLRLFQHEECRHAARNKPALALGAQPYRLVRRPPEELAEATNKEIVLALGVECSADQSDVVSTVGNEIIAHPTGTYAGELFTDAGPRTSC